MQAEKIEMNTDFKEIILEIKDRTAVITLNMPDHLNSMSKRMKSELMQAVEMIEADRDVWGVIITGNGKSFSSGTDINEFPDTVEEARQITAYAQKLLNRIEALEKPVIAAINGYAMGGGLELALVCDIRIAARKAKIGFPEVKLCAIPCYGGTQRLPRLIGAGKAKEMIYTGKTLTAEEACDLGIIEHVVDDGKEMDAAIELMNKILRNAPMAVSYAKTCINRGAESSLEYSLDLEKHLVSMLVPTKDLKEGCEAFLSKREPVFKNM